MINAASPSGLSRPPPRRPAPTFRRPFVGTLARTFRTPLPMETALERLRQAMASADVDGEIDGARAWLRARSRRFPAPQPLWLTVADTPSGTRVSARFDASAFQDADFLFYAATGFLGLVMIRLWTSGSLAATLRERLTIAFPALLVLLAAVVVLHFIFIRQKLQRDRRKVLDLAMDALGVAAE
jgi:hypothetical protein